ncbi:MAG: type II toxin-antitoxin system HicA family toxin [Candidatus Uhrbacteria bacterium]
MGKMPALKPSAVIRALIRVGFVVYHQRGSHVQLRYPVRPHLRVTIPRHSSFDLPPTVVASIIKQTGLSREEFLKLL